MQRAAWGVLGTIALIILIFTGNWVGLALFILAFGAGAAIFNSPRRKSVSSGRKQNSLRR